MAAIQNNLTVSDGRTVQLDAPADIWQIMKRRQTSYRATDEQLQKHGNYRVRWQSSFGWNELGTLPDSTSASGLDLECDVARITTGDYEGHVAGITDFTFQQTVIPANDVFSRFECSRCSPCNSRGRGLQSRRSHESTNEGGS